MFVPHIRMTLSGCIQDPLLEIFSMNIALGRGGSDAGFLWNDVIGAKPNDAVFTDWRDEAIAWFTRPTTRIRPSAVLLKVKFAHIGADGKYTAPPKEYATGASGTSNVGTQFPFQCAVAVTLGTDGDLGRVKGRFYQPCPAVVIDPLTGAFDAATAAEIRGSADTFLTALGNQPGLDVLDLGPVVASQGRFNDNGTERVPPRNHIVRRVSVGRVVDTIRSRRNNLNESPVWANVDWTS